MFIKDLTPGTRFTMDHPTVYRTLGVTVGAPGEGTLVRYCVDSNTALGEFSFHAPSLSTVKVV